MKELFGPIPADIPADAEVHTSYVIPRETKFTLSDESRSLFLLLKTLPDDQFLTGLTHVFKDGYDRGYEAVRAPFDEVIGCLSALVVCHLKHDGAGVMAALDAYVAQRVRLADVPPNQTH